MNKKPLPTKKWTISHSRPRPIGGNHPFMPVFASFLPISFMQKAYQHKKYIAINYF
jgi:hypothetical protein